MRKRFALVAVAVAAIFAGLSATPAVAAPLGVGSCVTGYICVYTDANYMGDIRQWTPAYIQSQTGHCLNFPLAINQTTSSIITPEGSGNTKFSTASGCSTAYPSLVVYAAPGKQGRVSNLQGSGFNDTFFSVTYNNGA